MTGVEKSFYLDKYHNGLGMALFLFANHQPNDRRNAHILLALRVYTKNPSYFKYTAPVYPLALLASLYAPLEWSTFSQKL